MQAKDSALGIGFQVPDVQRAAFAEQVASSVLMTQAQMVFLNNSSPRGDPSSFCKHDFGMGLVLYIHNVVHSYHALVHMRVLAHRD